MVKRYAAVVALVTLFLTVITSSVRRDLSEALVTAVVVAACATGGALLVAWVKRGQRRLNDQE